MTIEGLSLGSIEPVIFWKRHNAPRSGTWTFEKIKDGDFCTPTSSIECPELDKT